MEADAVDVTVVGLQWLRLREPDRQGCGGRRSPAVDRFGEQPIGTRLDPMDSIVDVERIARDVAGVGDLLAAKRRHLQAWMARAQ